jgi:hypothetical protein
VKKSISDFLAARKAEVEYRTDRTQATFGAPQLSASPVVYEIAEKTSAVAHGGVAVVCLSMIHQIAVQSGLVDRLNEVPILKSHLPYFESDHLLNIAYNLLCGGTVLDHIEYRRHDPTYLDMLGTHSAFVVYRKIPATNGSGFVATSGSSTGMQRLCVAGRRFLP